MREFRKLFKKVGGKEVLLQYMRSGVLVFAFLLTVLLGFSKKSLEIVRLAAGNRRLSKLRKKYKSKILYYKDKNNTNVQRNRSNIVWFFWLQGIENAPLLVQRCYSSMKENLQDKEIVLLTQDNYNEYVQFPEFIQSKIDMGIITKTHMSDLLRLELLIKYGGTWVDATVFCSGNEYPKYILDSDLFVFQSLKPGADGHACVISSWLMTSCTNNPIILLTRELLYDYWTRNNSMIDYFLIHDFFQLAIETYPEEWKKVVPFSNSTPHILLLRMFEEYDEDVWNAIKQQTAFHKLSYKHEDTLLSKKGTYYDMLINQ